MLKTWSNTVWICEETYCEHAAYLLLGDLWCGDELLPFSYKGIDPPYNKPRKYKISSYHMLPPPIALYMQGVDNLLDQQMKRRGALSK